MEISFKTFNEMKNSKPDVDTRKANVVLLDEAGVDVGRSGRHILRQTAHSVVDYEKALYEAAHNFGQKFYRDYGINPNAIPHLVDYYVYGTPIPNFVKQMGYWNKVVELGLYE